MFERIVQYLEKKGVNLFGAVRKRIGYAD